ncbi:MAG: hypothetical protein IPN32_32460 [Deltaproteobacteria bacterium]|nr:hypothetical protein [Deltaproteobacteria bacterium]
MSNAARSYGPVRASRFDKSEFAATVTPSGRAEPGWKPTADADSELKVEKPVPG